MCQDYISVNIHLEGLYTVKPGYSEIYHLVFFAHQECTNWLPSTTFMRLRRSCTYGTQVHIEICFRLLLGELFEVRDSSCFIFVPRVLSTVTCLQWRKSGSTDTTIFLIRNYPDSLRTSWIVVSVSKMVQKSWWCTLWELEMGRNIMCGHLGGGDIIWLWHLGRVVRSVKYQTVIL